MYIFVGCALNGVFLPFPQVFVMGQGDMGQLGLGEEMMERKKPYPVGGALEGLRVSQVVCGGMHTVALTDQGTVSGGYSGISE